MRFGSVCSGIEAASVAWHPLGWQAAWLAEIEPFPCAVLAHHYPAVPNLGDMTTIRGRIEDGEVEAPDLLCGGTPCQAFSVAGLRQSLADERGNLSLEFIRIADAIDRVRRAAGKQPAWVVWENVPGVLSTHDNAFGAFLGGLCGADSAIPAPAAGWPRAGVVDGPTRVVAWRVLDAQYFGLAQRRQRVFVLALGGAGRWACADALLPIGDSMLWHPAPSREAGQRPAPTLSARTKGGGGLGTDFDLDGGVIQVAPTITATYGEQCGQDYMNGLMAFAATDYETGAFDEVDAAAPLTTSADRTRSAPILAMGADCWNGQLTGDVAATMGTRGSATTSSGPQVLAATRTAMQVRRLTPEECEALQGFRRGYTLIPYRGKLAADGPRYKALGNSWAVPCARWIGQRINTVSLRQVAQPTESAGLQTCEPCQTGAEPGEQETSSQEKTQ